MTFREAYEKFRSIVAKRDEADRKLNELMGHKDFKTDVQMDDVHKINEAMAEYHERMCEVVTALREKYPTNRIGIPAPWARPEYDKYQRHSEATGEEQNS